MQARLFPKDQQEDYLDPHEAVSRIATSLPTALIDWVRGDRLVQAGLNKLVALDAPAPIIASHKSLFGRTAYVEVSFPEFPNQHVVFCVQPYSRIDITACDGNSLSLLRYAAEKLAAVLSYDFEVVQ